jgi:3-hydroxyacyl-[acyl-carrier-protein] dehydratase
MMLAEIEHIRHSLKREKMALSGAAATRLGYGREDIEKILPHRAPFAFIDRIESVDLELSMLEARSDVRIDDPVFEGHFPHKPVYPGVLQIEIMGQAGLCLAFFAKGQTVDIAQGAKPVEGLFTRVNEAVFLKPVLPGARLSVRVRMLTDDDFIGAMAAQVIVDDDICSFALLEVFYP